MTQTGRVLAIGAEPGGGVGGSVPFLPGLFTSHLIDSMTRESSRAKVPNSGGGVGLWGLEPPLDSKIAHRCNTKIRAEPPPRTPKLSLDFEKFGAPGPGKQDCIF